MAENAGGILTPTKEETVAKSAVKASIFTDLFSDKRYLLQLYKVFHPEDTKVTEEDLKNVTIWNVLTDAMYNDLGFMVGDRLVILSEAQSTWTMNIIVRALMYLAQTWHEYLKDTGQNYYASKKVKLPKPELYVVFTGKRKKKPETITLTEEFFPGQVCSIEVKVRVVYDGREGDILNQYVNFTRVYDEQRRKHGRTRRTVLETMRICRDRDILREYLESKESEVVDIMMSLFDVDEIERTYWESRCREAEERGKKRGEKRGIRWNQYENARNFLKMGKLSVEEIALGTGLTIEEVEKIREKM